MAEAGPPAIHQCGEPDPVTLKHGRSVTTESALSRAEFADPIASIPSRRWRFAGVTGTPVWLEPTDGTRIVGLP